MSPQPSLRLVGEVPDVSDETIRKCNAALDAADAHLAALDNTKEGDRGRDRRTATAPR